MGDLGNEISTDQIMSSLLDITTERQKLITTINQLERLGLSKDVVEVPKIIVVGDQSSGKSSLIERLM